MSLRPPYDKAATDDPDSEALDWFVRQRRGLDATEEEQFQSWLAADARHPAALARWSEDWTDLDSLPAQGIEALRKELAAEKAAAEINAGAQAGVVRGRPSRWGWRVHWLGGAAVWRQGALAAALFLAAGIAYLGWNYWQQQPIYTQTFATVRGQQLNVELPDGSRLRLDTATYVDVTLYRHRREVHMPEGQAFFQVNSDPARPFDVLSGPMRVTVLGTRFSVRYTPEILGENGVRVAVEEGRVRVSRADQPVTEAALQADDKGIVLTPGQQVASDAIGRLGPISIVAASGVAPWRASRISFDDTPLAQALAEFGRYGPTGMEVRDPAVAALGVTGTFDPRRIDNFARTLPQVLPVRLRTRNGMTEIVLAR